MARSQTKPAKPQFEYRAYAIAGDENQASRRLNNLIADGWEYVGPLGGNLVAFRRPTTAERLREQELAKWQGSWLNADDNTTVFEIDGGQWSWTNGPNGKVLASGTLEVIEVEKGIIRADLYHESGARKGSTLQAIFQVDGNAMSYASAVAPEERPRSFVRGQASQWKRVRPQKDD